MKKKFVLIMVIFLLLIICCSIKLDYSNTLSSNWGFSLPKEAKYSEIYNQSDEVSILGDGIRYHIFSYRNEEYIESLFEWTKNEGETRYNSNYNEIIKNWLEEINVSKKHYPNYSNCMYWYDIKEDNSEIIIIWSKIERKLYVVESFM